MQTPAAPNIMQKIYRSSAMMRPSERKVADFVLNNADQVINMRIVDLASACQVSEPTIVRFCKAIDYSGFQAFKLNLAQQQAREPDSSGFSVSANDSAAEFSNKVFDSTIDLLKKVRNSIDPDALESAINALCQANRVEFYGFGASAAVAIDAQHKFFRLRVSTAAYSDPHIMSMSAMSLAPCDVVIAISQTGRTKDLIDAIELAKEVGGTVIGIAPSGTPVYKHSSIPIHIDVQDDTESYTPLSSRIAHLVVIDILAVGVYQRQGPEIGRHLHNIKRGLKTLRTDS